MALSSALSGGSLPDDEIRSVLSRLPEDLAASLGNATVTPLAGLTNRVFRLDGTGVGVVIRLPRAETENLIDREAEAHNARIAEGLGIGAPILFIDTATGVMVTRLVPGVHPLSSGAVAGNMAMRAGHAFARLHGSGESFAGTFEPMPLIDVLAKETKAEDAGALLEHLEGVIRALERTGTAQVPGHCDPVAENLLDDGVAIRLIDWEYSAMADPAWDLAYFSLEAGLDAVAEATLVDAYEKGKARAAIARRVQLMKPVCDAVSALWALKQAQAGNSATDFAAYGAFRLARARNSLVAVGDWQV